MALPSEEEAILLILAAMLEEAEGEDVPTF